MVTFSQSEPTAKSRSRKEMLIWLIVSIHALAIIAIVTSRLFYYFRSPQTWQFIGEHLSHIYFGTGAVTAVACFIYAFVILALRSHATSAEGWSKYVGYVFIVLVAQYMFLFLMDALPPFALKGQLKIIINPLLSGLSNYYLVAAGLSLLDRDPFPQWNLGMQGAFAALEITLSLLDAPGQGFADASVSAFCIFWAGYALYRNITYTNSHFSLLTRRIMGNAVMASVILYASFGFVFASVPFIAKWAWNMPSAAAIEKAAQNETIKQRQGGSEAMKDGQEISAEILAEIKMDVRQQLLSILLVLLLFILKFVIFLAAFFLLLGAIIFVSSHHANEIFNPIINGVEEYLTDSGITKLVADNMNAASVALYVKIPWKEKTLYSKFAWPLEAAIQINRKTDESEIDELALNAMRSGDEQKFSPSHDERRLAHYFPLTYAQQLPTKVAAPIIFHGAVIGCILAISKTNHNFSPREVQHLRDLTKLSTLSVQSFRENAALDQLSFKYSRILSLKPVEKFHRAIDSIVDVLHEVLTPLATGIWLDVSLQRCLSLAGDGEYCQELKRRVENGGVLAGSIFEQEHEILTIDLIVKQNNNPDGKTYAIGKLAILVPAEKDEINHPVLGRNQMHFRAVAARTNSALLVAMTEYLGSVIREFGIRVNKAQSTNVEEWFREMETVADNAGLLWIVAETHAISLPLGRPEAIQTLRQMQKNDGKSNGCYLRYMPLRHSDGKVWIGVRGSSYNNGENVCSLWKSSFRQFADMADSALQRIINQQEKIMHLEHEAAQSYELATIAVTTAEIVHHIVNTTRDISLPLKILYDAYLTGRLDCADQRIGGLITSLPEHAAYLIEMTSNFKKLSDPKENAKCNLRQAAEQAERLFAIPIRNRRITFETDIADGLTVNVPPHIAVLAIATLVGNSKDAVANGGRIRIKAWEEGEVIRCDVTDNGHGVPTEVRHRLFRERNVTTKTNGNGWGLYLVSWSLKYRQGSIELTTSRPDETTFTIRLPKYNGAAKS